MLNDNWAGLFNPSTANINMLYSPYHTLCVSCDNSGMLSGEIDGHTLLGLKGVKCKSSYMYSKTVSCLNLHRILVFQSTHFWLVAFHSKKKGSDILL